MSDFNFNFLVLIVAVNGVNIMGTGCTNMHCHHLSS